MVGFMSLLSVSEASRLIGVCENTLREWDENGSFKAYRTVGGHRRYNLEDIRNYLDKQMPEKEKEERVDLDLSKINKETINFLTQKWEKYLDIDISDSHKDSLVVLIENEYSYHQLSAEPVISFDDKIWLLKHIFLRSRFLKMVRVEALNGPTGLVFYTTKSKGDTARVESEPIVAKIKAYNFTLFNSRPLEEMKEVYADALVQDIDNEILEVLRKIYPCDIESLLDVKRLSNASNSLLSEMCDYIVGPKPLVDLLKNMDSSIDYLYSDNMAYDKTTFKPASIAGRYPEGLLPLPVYRPYILIGTPAPSSLSQDKTKYSRLLRRDAWFIGKD
jgi:excisionase family DNA binding protein